jgi:hypothetical protein
MPTRISIPHGIIQRIAVAIDLLRILRPRGRRAAPGGRRRRNVRRGGPRAARCDGVSGLIHRPTRRGQGAGVRGQGSGVRGQGAGGRGQGAGVVTLTLPRWSPGQGSGVRGRERLVMATCHAHGVTGFRDAVSCAEQSPTCLAHRRK